MLGWMLERGIATKPDTVEALKWYRKSAFSGDATSQNNLGRMYYFGLGGLPKDYAMAAEWFHKAARAGNVLAQYILAQMHETGIAGAVEKDLDEAVELYQAAAKQQHKGAQCRLGRLYYYGQGVRQNYEMAAEWYEKAANQGDLLATGSLGVMVYEGTGIQKNEQKGLTLLRKAAAGGLKEVQSYMSAHNLK
jgi:TPR repeat protein